MKNIITLFFSLACFYFTSAQDAETNLKKAGIVLGSPKKPIASYVNIVQAGKLLYLSGKGPTNADGTDITGKLGKELTVEQGQAAAKSVAINHLAVLKDYLGDLNKVKRIVKVLGMVNCVAEFTQQPAVMNGYSDCMVAVFGEKGKHARSAVGMYALPNNIAVEVELIVEID